MASRLSVVVRKHVAVRAHGDEELVKAHGSVDGDFAAKIVFNFALFNGRRGKIAHQLHEIVYSHGGECVSRWP